MNPARTFQDLVVWQRAHALVLQIYRESRTYPKDETYGLVSQLRRAAVSVAANIAEGFKRRRRMEKVRFMNIAQASLEETRYYLILATDLGYRPKSLPMFSLEEVSRLLESYTSAIISNHNRPFSAS